ncbi:MAG: hypothetical protein CVV23_00460 [Ignavibacteriae bacterium HGW-Ignavibacteriae-2]|jgi:hypothetical protein|nr:MAG: hypothetical protein CVV23_00460 [Ignavibacteriae bacterium HGW-Ignavibacteriae-2]
MKKNNIYSNIFHTLIINMKSLKYTIISVAISVVLLISIVVLYPQIFNKILDQLVNNPNYGIIGIIGALVLIIIGLSLDFYRKELKHKRKKISKDNSYSIYRAILESINEIICNYIQSMQLYKIKMEDKSDMQIEIDFDELTSTTISKLKKMQFVDEVENENFNTDSSIIMYKSTNKFMN